MKIIKTKILSEKKYFETHLALINVLLPIKMTPMEIVVLSRFMLLKGDIAKERFGATARKMVKEDLKISSASLSIYLSTLEGKGFIIKKDGETGILPILIPDDKEQLYNFKLVINEDTK